MPTHQQLMEAVEDMQTVLFGDHVRGKKGLLERVNTIEDSVNKIVTNSNRIVWLLIAGIIGALLNLVLNAKQIETNHQNNAPAAHANP